MSSFYIFGFQISPAVLVLNFQGYFVPDSVSGLFFLWTFRSVLWPFQVLGTLVCAAISGYDTISKILQKDDDGHCEMI